MAEKLSGIFPNLGTPEDVKAKLLENGRKNIEGGAAGVTFAIDNLLSPLVGILERTDKPAALLLKTFADKAKEKIEPTKVKILEKIESSS